MVRFRIRVRLGFGLGFDLVIFSEVTIPEVTVPEMTVQEVTWHPLKSIDDTLKSILNLLAPVQIDPEPLTRS